MHTFNVKSLAFYAIAISSVLLVFKVVTAYGESQLKAPKSISGKYNLILADNLSGSNCKKNTLVLNIQQSGIFLNASLLQTPTNKEISTDEENNFSLNGRLNNQQLSLKGKVNKTSLCDAKTSEIAIQQASQNTVPAKLTLQASLVPQGGFSGQITLNGIPKSIKFNAIPQKRQEQSRHLSKSELTISPPF
jgi:hypothetical protein